MQCIIINNIITYLFQIIIQGISFCSLFIKRRYFEFPKRTYQTWKFDIYKQLSSSIITVFCNIIFYINITDTLYCEWYFIYSILDVLITTFISFILVKIINYVAIKSNMPNIEMGFYGPEYSENNDALLINEFNTSNIKNHNNYRKNKLNEK